MKHILLLFTLLISSYGYSQDCTFYSPETKGSTWEITNYSGKGKEDGKTTYELVNKSTNAGVTTFEIKAISYDKKGKEIFNSTFNAECKDGKYLLDMSFLVNGAMMEAYKDMEVEIENSSIQIPSMDTPAGTNLEDATMKININAGGFEINMKVDITDRKVETKEKKTTPAGTFECIKLSQKTTTKIIAKIETTSKDWYAEGIGMVRTESYNKKGKLMGYSELTKLNKK